MPAVAGACQHQSCARRSQSGDAPLAPSFGHVRLPLTPGVLALYAACAQRASALARRVMKKGLLVTPKVRCGLRDVGCCCCPRGCGCCRHCPGGADGVLHYMPLLLLATLALKPAVWDGCAAVEMGGVCLRSHRSRQAFGHVFARSFRHICAQSVGHTGCAPGRAGDQILVPLRPRQALTLCWPVLATTSQAHMPGPWVSTPQGLAMLPCRSRPCDL